MHIPGSSRETKWDFVFVIPSEVETSLNILEDGSEPTVRDSSTSLGMTKTAIIAQFDRLVPLAANWVQRQEKRMLRIGVPLSDQEQADANAIGVAEPDRVRLLQLDRVPFPTDPMLKAAATAIQFLTPATCGLTLRYGIFVRSDCWRERALIAHELVHVMQYERLGGILPFLRQYLSECLTNGYPAAPMEQEAIRVSKNVLA